MIDRDRVLAKIATIDRCRRSGKAARDPQTLRQIPGSAADLAISPATSADLPQIHRSARDLAISYESYRAEAGDLDWTYLSPAAVTLRMPEMHAEIHKNYRRALVRRFPYMVFYEFSESVA